MSQATPRFLDETRPDPVLRQPAVTGTVPPSPVIETPILLQPEEGAASAVGADWNPASFGRVAPRYGSVTLLAAGLGIILAAWVGFSIVGSLIGFYQVSPGLGLAASLVCLAGTGLLAAAGIREWRALRSLHRVDALRSALRGDADLEATRLLCLAWLDHIGTQLPEATQIAAAVRDAPDVAHIRALLRNRLAEPLRAATRSLGLRAATEASALVAVSPHASWDGLIVALRGLRVIRQAAQLHGLRPGAAVTVALLNRVARSAVETAAVDLLSQSAADHVLNNLPVIKHLGALAGASTAAFRLYRLTHAAARACNPLAE